MNANGSMFVCVCWARGRGCCILKSQIADVGDDAGHCCCCCCFVSDADDVTSICVVFILIAVVALVVVAVAARVMQLFTIFAH